LKILVTGGAGFIGSHVVDAYIAAGHEVGVMDNLSTGREENVNQAAKLHRVDVTNRAQVHAAIASFKPEVVNHHAAQSEVPKSVADPGHDALVNVVGGLNVLRACVDEAVRKVIFSSTGGALYGEPDIGHLREPDDRGQAGHDRRRRESVARHAARRRRRDGKPRRPRDG